MVNVTDKSCRENQNTHCKFKNSPPPRKLSHLRDNVGKYGTAGQTTDDNIMLCMRTACWIPKATKAHSEYVTLIVFPLQQWLRKKSSMLRHAYIA